MLAPHFQSKAREKFHQFALQDHMISLGLQRFTCFNRWASVDNAFYDGHLGIPTAISSETSAAHVSCAHRTCHTNRFRNGQIAFQKMKKFEVCSLSPFLVGGGWLPLVPSAEVVVSLSLRLHFFSDCLPEPSFHPSHFLLYNLKKKKLSWILTKQLRLASLFVGPVTLILCFRPQLATISGAKKALALFWEAQTLLQTISSLRMALGKVVLPETKTIAKRLCAFVFWCGSNMCQPLPVVLLQAPLHIKNKRWSQVENRKSAQKDLQVPISWNCTRRGLNEPWDLGFAQLFRCF